MTYTYVQAAYDYGIRKATLGLAIHGAEAEAGVVGYLSRAPLRGVSANFVCERTGRMVQMLGDNHISGAMNPADRSTDKAYYGHSHLVDVLGSYWTDPNVAIISVEGEWYAAKGPNQVQVEALERWAADMRAKHPTLRGAIGHADQTDTKGCPGSTPLMFEAFRRMGGHGLWTATPEAPVGYNIELAGTKDTTPLDAFLTAKVKGAGHTIHRVHDATSVAVADGLDLGTVEQATLVGTIPAWAGTDTRVLAFNYGTHGLYVARLGDCAIAALPKPVDTTPYSKDDMNAAAHHLDAPIAALVAAQKEILIP